MRNITIWCDWMKLLYLSQHSQQTLLLTSFYSGFKSWKLDRMLSACSLLGHRALVMCVYNYSNYCHKNRDIFRGQYQCRKIIWIKACHWISWRNPYGRWGPVLWWCAGLAGVTEDGQYGAGLRGKFTAAMVCQFCEALLHVHRVQLLLHCTCSTQGWDTRRWHKWEMGGNQQQKVNHAHFLSGVVYMCGWCLMHNFKVRTDDHYFMHCFSSVSGTST